MSFPACVFHPTPQTPKDTREGQKNACACAVPTYCPIGCSKVVSCYHDYLLIPSRRPNEYSWTHGRKKKEPEILYFSWLRKKKKSKSRKRKAQSPQNIYCSVSPERKIKSFYQILEAINDGRIRNFIGYKNQVTYIIQAYDPKEKSIVDIKLFRTEETFEKIVEDFTSRGWYPLLCPNPVKIPKGFWERYRKTATRRERIELIKECELLTDKAIFQLRVIALDIDSNFDEVLPHWEKLKEELGITKGYAVVKTKSGRFRAYIFLEPSEIAGKEFYLSVKHLNRAREFIAIVGAYFKKAGLNFDLSFQRVNHPLFVEGIDYNGKKYEIVEVKKGYAGKFYSIYRKVKHLQKKEELWYLGETYLPGKFWNRKPPAKGKKAKIIKAPAFLKMLKEKQLDVLELWKRAVLTLSQKHSNGRYIHVIQPAIGWSKYLELPKEEINEYLLSLLGEKKSKDIEKGWKYAAALEFKIPDRIEWAGKTREEWEKEALTYILNRGIVERQELIKEVFHNQKWLCDMILEGLEKKGKVEWFFLRDGRKGRPPKVFRLAEEQKQALPKAVGGEEITLENQDVYFSQNNNSFRAEPHSGGGWLSFAGIIGARIPLSFFIRIVHESRNLSDRQTYVQKLLEKYSSLRTDFQARAEALKKAVRGRVRRQTFLELWRKDKELYKRLWDLFSLFKVVELPKEDALLLVLPPDVAELLKTILKEVTNGKQISSEETS